MTHRWRRRGVLTAIGASALVRPAAAQQGALERIKQRGSIKIGIADNLPWSKLNPDGTLSGIGPSIIAQAFSRLGVPKVEAVVGSYGELIPGLLAGRWDMVGASLTISPERCQQVIFGDPFYRKGETPRYFGYIKADMKDPLPKTYTDAAGRFDKIGISTGDAFIPALQAAITSTGNKATIVQFTDQQLLIEGLLTKRVPVVIADLDTFNVLQKQRGGFEVSPADSGQPNRGSGPAFRKQDTDLRDAFNAEYRALKKSGEAEKILNKFGFDYMSQYMEITGDQACSL